MLDKNGKVQFANEGKLLHSKLKR
ncbi:hypothetical protein [Aggregatibacter actinomycetemcomitans]|nr:hypothetical protein [Aggregatibacter actinomycetemcomitans]UXM98566.1 hypothetical protein N7761_02570 [Aggregatibacter actinomycetemcomitans]